MARRRRSEPEMWRLIELTPGAAGPQAGEAVPHQDYLTVAGTPELVPDSVRGLARDPPRPDQRTMRQSAQQRAKPLSPH